MSVNAYKEVTFSRKKCHESCKISMLGWAPIHTSQPLDGWTTINVRLYQRSTFQEQHNHGGFGFMHIANNICLCNLQFVFQKGHENDEKHPPTHGETYR